MTNKPLIFIMVTLALGVTSCSDETLLCENATTNETGNTRALVQDASPTFDWENNNYIELQGIGNVVLPWYSGATTTIPSDILDDYKKRDGWVMLYNSCTPSASGMTDLSKPYLIFYNVLTGRLRTYAYMNRNVTGGNTTFWEVSFKGETLLTNDFDSVVVAYDGGQSINKMQYVSNLTNIPAKSLSLGWNCFDMDLAIYDPDISRKNSTMSIYPFDAIDLNFGADGSYDLRTEGTIISINTNESLPFNLDNIITKGISHGDKAIEKLLKKIGDKNADKHKTSVMSLLNKGANWLATKFLGRSTTSIDSSLIKMTTTGTSKITGKLSGNTQSNMPSMSNLMVPGSQIIPSYTLIPSYNKPLGVFYIAKTPTLCLINRYNTYYPTGSTVPPVHGEEGASYQRMNIYGYFTIGCKEPIEVVLNPEIMSKIDHYSVSTAIIGDADWTFNPKTDSDGHNIGALAAKVYDGKFICTTNNNSAVMMYVKKYASSVSIPKDPEDAAEYYERYKNLIKPTMPSNVELKVSVTLYPKAPQYNPTPIVLTRTITCNVEKP